MSSLKGLDSRINNTTDWYHGFKENLISWNGKSSCYQDCQGGATCLVGKEFE